MFPSYLTLKNGARFTGLSPLWQNHQEFTGEVVFTTGMTGYVESLTDPSYKGQILVFTSPLIGNYGVPDPTTWESEKIHASGVIVSESCANWSHTNSTTSLAKWLEEQHVPLMTEVDTRALTQELRGAGSMMGIISGKKASRPLPTALNKNVVGEVTISAPRLYGHGKKTIIAVDCGMKENIIRCLTRFPLTVKRVPYDYDYTKEDFDGVFISNGPGDPEKCTATIAILKQAFKSKKPIFGICLGSQLMALAAGAKTYKLRFGHRGHNQPCLNETTGQAVITSQNHGYAVDEKTLPKEWYVNFKNLNDGSVEGVAHKKLPFFSVQFHPEAAPGPTDTRDLFQKFFDLL